MQKQPPEVFLEISQNSHENTCVRVSFLIKLEDSALQLYLKKTVTHSFSCEACNFIKKGPIYVLHPYYQIIPRALSNFRFSACVTIFDKAHTSKY